MTIAYIRNNNCEAVQLDHEWIILNTDHYTATKLNEIGGCCWSLLKNAQTVQSLLQEIEKEYVLCSESVEQDIRQFLDELLQCGLIQYAES